MNESKIENGQPTLQQHNVIHRLRWMVRDLSESITDAELATRMGATNQYIQQGAFQVVVNTSGAKDNDEAIKMITDKIEQTFAVLARELAAK